MVIPNYHSTIKLNIYTVVISIFVFSLISCSNYPQKLPEGVEVAIKKSGGNKIELIKVIHHYQLLGNELKLKACYYLIENMVDKYHYESQSIHDYQRVFNKMDSIVLAGHPVEGKTWDSIYNKTDWPDLSSVEVVKDIETIKADFLIESIDKAFASWNYPWSKNVSFKQFCENILPYKLGSENIEEWKGVIQNKYSWILDSMKDNRDVRKACILINHELMQWFYINARHHYNWDLSMSDLMKIRIGTCDDAAQMAAYAMRGMGIPVARDYTPYWANKNFGHGWNTLIYKGKSLPFVGSESDPGKTKIEFTKWYLMRRKMAKVYRKTYTIQKNSLLAKVKNPLKIPSLFRSKDFKDVTQRYVPVSNVKIHLTVKSNKKYAYLCIFNDRIWRPIAWAGIHFLGNVFFKNMGRGIVYLPILYDQGDFIYAAPPFILTASGEIQYLAPQINDTGRIVLYKKYPEDQSNHIIPGQHYELMYWNNEWVSLGRKLATTDSLVYTNAPGNALFWIRNLDEGVQERIFTCNNEKPIWW